MEQTKRDETNVAIETEAEWGFHKTERNVNGNFFLTATVYVETIGNISY